VVEDTVEYMPQTYLSYRVIYEVSNMDSGGNTIKLGNGAVGGFFPDFAAFDPDVKMGTLNPRLRSIVREVSEGNVGYGNLRTRQGEALATIFA
jgi:hypothetical protein